MSEVVGSGVGLDCELARTKVFSKVKISHNYFEEFAGEFKVQASKILEISKSQSLKKGPNQSVSLN